MEQLTLATPKKNEGIAEWDKTINADEVKGMMENMCDSLDQMVANFDRIIALAEQESSPITAKD